MSEFLINFEHDFDIIMNKKIEYCVYSELNCLLIMLTVKCSLDQNNVLGYITFLEKMIYHRTFVLRLTVDKKTLLIDLFIIEVEANSNV
jgi:hypothetical protein